MNLRSTVARFTSYLKPREIVGEVASPAQTPASNPYVATRQDIDELAAASTTRLERVYYRHRGRVVFKWSHYLAFYDRILSPLVGKDITLVEIGLAGGGSVQLWREYLGPQIRVIGVDIDPNCLAYAEPGVEILIGDQGSREFLAEVAAKVGDADIVIDDGSHINAHQILTLTSLFPIVKEGGVYICEDLHTSYWPDWGGGLGKNGTFIEYLKTVLDRLHARYYGSSPSENDLFSQIGTIEVEDSIVALTKKPSRRKFIVEVGGEGGR